MICFCYKMKMLVKKCAISMLRKCHYLTCDYIYIYILLFFLKEKEGHPKNGPLMPWPLQKRRMKYSDRMARAIDAKF